MSQEQKENFIKKELYHELCCLLEAATFWQVLKDSGVAGCEISIAMDSALVHARNLFIFFASTKGDKENDNSAKMTDFGVPEMYQALIYSQSKDAMNRHVFHLDIKRMKKPTNLKKSSGHINEKPQRYADEILRLWEMFEKEDSLGELGAIAKAARLRAIDDAHNTSKGRIASMLRNAQALENESSAQLKDSNQFVS